jgi:hypothetical protein
MAVYDKNTSGASNQAGVWNAIRTQLLAAGWTETTVVTTAGSRNSVFAGIALDQTAGNTPFIGVVESVSSNLIYVTTGSDFDSGTKTLINSVGSNSTTQLVTSSTQNTWWIRANGYALFCNVLTGASAMWKVYAGWLHRGLVNARGGITKCPNALSIGGTTINTSSSMVGRLMVGQKVLVVNFGHSSAATNKANAELVTISSITSGALGVSALTKNYDTGAIIGDRVMNTGVMGNCFVEWGNMLTPLQKNGTFNGTSFYSSGVIGTSTMKPDNATAEYPFGFIVHSWNSGSAGSNGWMGTPFHVMQSYFGSQSYNDIFNDGQRTYNMIGVTTGISVSVASDGVGGTTYPLLPRPGTIFFDVDGETAIPAVPAATTAPTAVAGNAQATVTWTAASSDWPNAVTAYRVMSYPDGVTATVGNVLTATVTGLTNGIKYVFTVRATNAVGDGPESLQSTGVTPSATATAPGVPTNVSATPFGTSGAITWDPPVSNGGSAITGYTVSGIPGAPFTVTGSYYLVTGLTPGTTYSVTVKANNSVGSSSTVGVSLAIASVVPSAPQSFASSLVTATTATVSWTAPSTNGGASITGYTITGHPAGPTTVGAGVTSLALTGLSAHVLYSMSIVATNSVGDGAAATTSFTSNFSVPGPPQSFTATAYGSTEALLTWEDPSELGGSALIYYRITGLPGGTIDIAGTNNSYFVTTLSPGTLYSVTVSVNNSLGFGSYASASFTTAANPAVPSVPLNLAISSITPTTATFTWSNPADIGGSALTGFTIGGLHGGSSTVSAATHTITAAFLSPNTLQTFTIFASNSNGDGPAANISFLTTSTPPSVSIVSPTSGSGVARNTPLVFEISSSLSLERVVVLVSQGDTNVAELAYDGVRSFTLPYAAGSSVTHMLGNYPYVFTLVRNGGWVASPTVEVVAVDVAGKES